MPPRLFIGIDVGSVSVKIAGFTVSEGDPQVRLDFDEKTPFYWSDHRTSEGYPIFLSQYRRLRGQPAKATIGLLEELVASLNDVSIQGIVLTGSGLNAVRDLIPAVDENEFKAITQAVSHFYPQTRAVFELGGENSKFIQLEKDQTTGALWIRDYGVNGDCAAGTGSFIDQQATRLQYKIEDVGEITAQAGRSAHIAGRCSVFAKSDMIHAQQRGYSPSEVLSGLMDAVSLNYKANITRGHRILPPVLLIGGVGQNSGITRAIKKVFELKDEDLMIPKEGPWLAAIGASILASNNGCQGVVLDFNEIRKKMAAKKADKYHEKLSTENVVFLRDREKDFERPDPLLTPFKDLAVAQQNKIHEEIKIPVYLGIDIGSVSTNVVLLSEEGQVVKEIYTRTLARPIEVVTRCMKEVEAEWGDRVEIKGVGTTGSGRELIGELVGADTIRDEITAHKTGAYHIARTLTDGIVDTIFEIGGQDSKFISISNGIVVDFTMNEACAAGTGSFLEEQAEKLGVQIKEEFAAKALSSKHPLKMGERCTVFMERDVNAYQHKGASIPDICAGLAYSIVTNYLNRVVRGRKIGDHIFFQGGTAYNDAVAAAFSKILGKQIIVPPHNGVMGAIGAALLAHEEMKAENKRTKFHGYDIDKVPYTLKEFTCQACSNHCDIQMFKVKDTKTYWGDKCSDRYRKKARTERKPVIKDLFEERQNLLYKDYDPSKKRAGPTIGFPRSMYFFDRFPFFRTYFETLGCNVAVSSETNKQIVHQGLSATVAEPCFPIQVAHGHVLDIWNKGVDYIWLPNITTAERRQDSKFVPYLCPWGMTLPFVVKNAPEFDSLKDKILHPTLSLFHGEKILEEKLWEVAKRFGASRRLNKKAVRRASMAQIEFFAGLTQLGIEALNTLFEKRESGIVIVGRPYNVHDRSMNLNVPKKLRDNYGMNVIPFDMLPLHHIDIGDIVENMFWNYGQKIMRAARYTAGHPDLHLIYITNFKCGPDSFVKHYTKEAAQKPYLTIQLDAHSNDAGVMTRVEAYLDSKGLLSEAVPEEWQEKEYADIPVVPQCEGDLYDSCTSVKGEL